MFVCFYMIIEKNIKGKDWLAECLLLEQLAWNGSFLNAGILIFCWAPALNASVSIAAALEPVSWTGVSDELNFRVTFPATLSDMGLTCRRRAVTWNSNGKWLILSLQKYIINFKARMFLPNGQLASSVLRRRTTSWFLFWASRSLSWCYKIILNKLK